MDKKYIPLNLEPMLLSDKQLAVVLNISVAHIHALDNAGVLPRPRRLKKSIRWSVCEIREWIVNGCKNRAEMATEKLDG